MGTQIIDCAQRTPEWFKARAGLLTGSVADAVDAFIKTGEAAARRDLRLQLSVERITGLPMEFEGYVSKEMQRGIDLEPAALSRYEAETGELVRKTGFVRHDGLPIGCSLDGDVDGFKGIVELKCPKSATQVGYIRANRLPSAYVNQVTHNLWVTGADYCDFVSFDDRLPSPLEYFRIRVTRADVPMAAYEKAAIKFLAEVAVETDQLRELIKMKKGMK